jgi:phospholipid/cholesterol/gamma-HCH transport system substrate-binding protein
VLTRRPTLARVAAVGALAAFVVLVIALVVNSSSGYSYNLLFQNAGQLVNDNQVLVGGEPIGSVDSIDLTSDNLASVHVTVDQQLHEGSTAVIRATSLSGVANHYISVSPGPNSNPALPNGATLGLASTTTSADLDQLFSTFTPKVRTALSQFIQGSAAIYAGRGEEGNQTYKYLGPGLNRTNAFFGELTSDQRLLRRFIVSSGRLFSTLGSRSDALASSVSNANTAFGAIASQSQGLDLALRQLAPTLRQSNTTFVNLRAALDDLDPLVNTAKTSTRNLAPFLADLRPVAQKAVPVFRNLRLTVARPGSANDLAYILKKLPTVQKRSSNAFPNAIRAIQDFQPTLNLARSYTPDILNALTKLGQVTAYYDGAGHYVRASPGANLFNYNGGTKTLEPIPPSDNYSAFGSPTNRQPCPGGATQSAADNSNPFVNPPWGASSATTSDCNPADAPPGP